MICQYSVAVPTRAPTGQTNVYVIGEDNALLVDPAGRTDELDDTVFDRVAHVAVTHHHPDHVGALEFYAREYDLTVWARVGRARMFEAATGIAPDRLYSPGETIPAASGVDILDTPGHAPEHVTFVVDEEFVTGDLAVAAGSVVVGAPEGDMRAYLSSLRRVRARDPDRLLPGHGPVIDQPRATCDRLLEHRLDRERKVLAAIAEGSRTPEEILEAAYEKDIESVSDLARATVIAHIEKLAVEKKVTWDGHTARPV